MGQINVNTVAMRSGAAVLGSVQRTLNDVATTIGNANSSLTWNVSVSSKVASELSACAQKAQALAADAGALRNAIDDACNSYEQLEGQLAGKALGTSIQTLTNTNSGGSGGGDVATQDLAFLDAFDDMKKILDALGKVSDDSETGVAAGICSLVNSLYGLYADDPEGLRDIMQRLTDFAESLSDLYGAIEELAGDSAAGSILGFVGSFISTFGSLLESTDGTVSDYLTGDSDVMKGGRDIAVAFWKMTSGSVDAELLAQISTINAAFVAADMGTTAVGDVMERSADGVYDVSDYGQTCLETGITGASDLVKIYTLGLISVDVDSAVDTFNNNVDWANDAIANSGLPMWAQWVATVPAIIGVAGVSVGEVIGDTIINTGEKIVNIVQLCAALNNAMGDLTSVCIDLMTKSGASLVDGASSGGGFGGGSGGGGFR